MFGIERFVSGLLDVVGGRGGGGGGGGCRWIRR